MRIIALMSWFDEYPAWLAEAIASYAGIVSHVVAVDGAYALWPDARARSAQGQVDGIIRTANRLDMGCTLHQPDRPWAGNEVEKRSAMYALGETVASSGDWFVVVDADERLTSAPPDIFDRLERTSCDVADLTLWMPALPHGEERVWTGQRRLFRAGLNLHVRGTHAQVWTGDGRPLCGPNQGTAESSGIRVEHRDSHRKRGHAAAKNRYYELRDELGIEPAPNAALVG